MDAERPANRDGMRGRRRGVWDAQTGRPTGREFHLAGGVTAIAVSRHVDRVAIGGADGSARVWDLITGEAISTPIATGGPVTRMALGPQAEQLLTAGGGVAHLWDAVSGKEKSNPMKYRQDITDAALSPDGQRVGIATVDGTGGVWNATNRDWADDVLRHGSIIQSIAFSADSRWVATASEDNTARIWNADTDGPRTPPLPHSGAVRRAAFSPDGRWLLTAGEDGLAKLWKLRDVKAETNQKLPDLSGETMVRSSDGSIVIKASGQIAQVYDAHTGKPLSKSLVHAGPITSVALSPDGTLAATASADRTAIIWNWRTGAPVGPPLHHGSRVNDVIFSPDGSRVATGSDDNTARDWDANTAASVTSPLPLSETVCAVRFSPDGKLLLAAGKRKYARVWEAAGGVAIALVPRTGGWAAAVLARQEFQSEMGFADRLAAGGRIDGRSRMAIRPPRSLDRRPRAARQRRIIENRQTIGSDPPMRVRLSQAAPRPSP